MTEKAEIKLGDKVRDTLTKLKGIVTARCEYITGCIQFEVQPEDLHNGTIVKAPWIDEMRLERIPPPKPRKPASASDESHHGTRAAIRRRTGGSQSNPERNSPPSSIQYDEASQ